MTLSYSSTDLRERQRLPSSRARCCLRFRLCRSIRCVYRLLITCSFPLQAGFIQRPAIRHPYPHVKGDSRLIRRPSVAIVRSPNTCATTVFGACHTRKNSQRWRSCFDVSPLFVHFRADDGVTARLYARGYRLRPEFLNGGKSCWGQRP